MIEGHGLFLEHVETSRRQAPLTQRGRERKLIDDAAARRVDQHRPRLHAPNRLLIEQIARFGGESHVQAHEVRLGEQLIERDRLDAVGGAARARP